MGDKQKKDFFISYNSNDEKWALWIDKVVKKAGYTTIIQAVDFKAGSNFMLDMDKAIECTERTIAILSRNYSNSNFCKLEATASLVQDPASENIKLIPIRIDESYKPTGLLRTIRYIDLIKLNNEDISKGEKAVKAGEWLINEIKAILENIPIPKKIENPFDDGARVENTSQPFNIREKSNLKFERNSNFTGREKHLEQIKGSVEESGNALITQVITGLGGIGKTQLVVEYIYRNYQQYDLIWWFEANDEEGIKLGFSELALKLGLGVEDKEKEVAITKEYLEKSHIKWLLVYDNADSIELKNIKAFMPKVRSSGHIIVTSRRKNWRGMGNEITLDLWGKEEGREFLLKTALHHSKKTNDKQKAEELVELLGGLPLALEQAAAYIDNEEISIEKYILKFNECEELLKECFSYDDPNEKNIATTWKISFDKAKEEEGFSEILAYICAYFAPEGIPEKVFEGVIDDDLLHKAILALNKYSLITKQDDLLYMHRMVQYVVRENLKSLGQEETYIGIVLKILVNKFIGKINSNEDLEFNKYLFYHAHGILKYDACKELSPINVSILMRNLGVYLYNQVGYYNEAISYLKKAVEIDREIGSKQGEAANLGNIGLIYSAKGEVDEALFYHKQALEIHKEIGYKQGEANQLGNIGVIYRDKEEVDEALFYLKQALEIHREIGSKQGEASDLGNIGGIYYIKGEVDESLNYYKQALEIDREIGYKQGEANDLAGIGLIYRAKGEVDKALIYLKQALEIHREIGYKQGEANQLGNIGVIYRDKGEVDEALFYLKQALEIHREIGYKQGEANQLGNIGVIYRDKGEVDEALFYLKQALEILETYGLVYGRNIFIEAIHNIES